MVRAQRAACPSELRQQFARNDGDDLGRIGLPNDPIFQGYEVSTLLNTGSASVRGMEVAYRQSLTFLPAWAKGVQVFVNATRLEVDGSNSADFTGFNPKT